MVRAWLEKRQVMLHLLTGVASPGTGAAVLSIRLTNKRSAIWLAQNKTGIHGTQKKITYRHG